MIHKNSTTHWLSTFAIGESRLREFENKQKALSFMRQVRNENHWPVKMDEWEFTVNQGLLVLAKKPLEPTIVVKVERKK